MKELTIEEKAQAYDKAIKRAKDALNDGTISSNTIAYLRDIFPELKESEDEKVREELIELIGCMHDADPRKGAWLAWLEKQGEQKHAIFIPKFRVGDKLVSTRNPRLTYEILGVGHINELGNPEYKVEIFTNGKAENPRNIHDMECSKVDEWAKLIGHKPADKIELKFHEGDWVVYNNDICQIVKREEGCNRLVTIFGIEKELVNERNLSTARLWTIEDAKDGDVLAVEPIEGFSSSFVAIYKNQGEKDFVSHCFVGFDGKFYEGEDGHSTENIHPATKEQRELLFSKMHEAGYMWDDEKKELKKIEKQDEQNPADKAKPKFKVGDWVVITTTKEDRVVQIASVQYFTKDGYPSYITTEGRWFGKGTKARLLTDKDVKSITIPESKAIVNKIKSWSEEDEHRLKDTIYFLDTARKHYASTVELDACIDWLKSLKQRMEESK